MPAVAQLEELAEVPISRTPRRVTSASADWQTVSDSAAEEHVRTPFELDHETLDPADRRRVKTAVHITDLQGIPADQLHSISHQNAGAGPSTTEGAWLTGGIEDEIPSAPSPAVYYVRP